MKPTKEEIRNLAKAFMEDPKTPFIWIDEKVARDLAAALPKEER